MKRTAVISVSLPREDVELLDRLATQSGSRSSAIRGLIARQRKSERDAELEEAYRAYYADPENRRDMQQWTRDMLKIASWPDYEGGGKRGRKGRPAR
jgi:metal-responsive CopG/Arc/MetJ family transcriptional regulator